jgi:hypothetical protein
MVPARGENESETRQRLKRELSAQAEARWGAERLHELIDSIDSTARILAHLASLDLTHDEPEPDFLR